MKLHALCFKLYSEIYANSMKIKSLSAVFQKLTGIERWLRLGTGLAILLIGIYLTLQHVYRIVG